MEICCWVVLNLIGGKSFEVDRNLDVLDQCQSAVNKTQLLQSNSDQKHCASKLRNPLFASYQCKIFLLCEVLFAHAIP